MPDLRRQVLESGKTVSRKARSRIASGASSKAGSTTNSRNASRTASRNVSDEEEGNLSDETTWSTNSEDVINPEELDAPADVWKSQLGDRMAEIIDRKRSSNEGRADSLAQYSFLLKAHYAAEDIEHKIGELIPAILKSAKYETSERETVMALKAIELTVITSPSDSIYDAIVRPVQNIINESQSIINKTAAIRALATSTFYGGASVDSTVDIMDYFVEIIESDGHSIEAGDEAGVVTAALEEWGFLATQIDDIEDHIENAVEAFVDQLDSSDLRVQIAAGENIALVYEKAYGHLSLTDEPSSDEDADDGDVPQPAFTVYRREDQLKHKLEALSTTNALEVGRVAKKDRSRMRSNFSDILNSVEHPGRGPRYSTALHKTTGANYGSRMTVKIGHSGEMRIDKWWKLFRLNALRRTLQGGFIVHYEDNEVVFDSLPIMISRKDHKDGGHDKKYSMTYNHVVGGEDDD